MIICFAIAIPRGIPAMINQPENPVFYIFRQQVGSAAVTALKVIVFIVMFSALLANMAVGVLWWLLYLRPRLAAGTVGIGRGKDDETFARDRLGISPGDTPTTLAIGDPPVPDSGPNSGPARRAQT